MKAPIENEKYYEIHGNKYENLLASNDHVYINEIEEAQKDKDEVNKQENKKEKKMAVTK